jgi:hypothetical protein
MSRTVGVGLLFLVALAACTHFKQSPPPAAEATARSAPPDVRASSETPPTPPPVESPPTGSPTADSPAAGPPSAESPPAPSPAPAGSAAKPAQPKTAGSAKPKTPRVTGAPAAGSPAAGSPAGGSPAGGSSKPSPAEQRAAPAGAEPATPAAAQAATTQPVAKPPALDLAGLERRLKDTHAIGLFTKLSLKNQVDDLLGAFRAFHGGQNQPPLAELRQRYDLLLLKVLTLLQDGDPPLASAISASREAIWGLLADRDKFQKIQVS